jgi:hypothetical protein
MREIDDLEQSKGPEGVEPPDKKNSDLVVCSINFSLFLRFVDSSGFVQINEVFSNEVISIGGGCIISFNLSFH